ncbi:MAG TPA: hypothetical protein DCZ01_01015 [Elusimicrobia bacterium]|nr:MAG: hypothetical protein A2X37_03115 [Elusimicrobia bacterium GWA2_66_18]OGR70365.1 MAG: hypothetical protein A2X40_04345 [Elusimicrobia bacterium GWC2_65_9]HAZ07113.1 hypothetical protein [Elusimicrobiota bacterium]HBB66840.1 hypothetical protein [Elusimicrobiota bacterium]
MKKQWFFAFFVASGFCGLVYEIVWLRLVMASFGVNTQMISLFLSMFMAGLGLGSWAAGRLLALNKNISGRDCLKLYAGAEGFIALGGLGVPPLLAWGHALLSSPNPVWIWDSAWYYAASGLCVAVAVVPWCVAMGATIPLAMASIRKLIPSESEHSFSYLYVANVLGAAAGAMLSAFVLIEIFGFTKTARLTAVLNLAIAVAASLLAYRSPESTAAERSGTERQNLERASGGESSQTARHFLLTALFITGCLSMALEVVWTRQLMPYIGLHVYSFAGLLFFYLVSTTLGSSIYREYYQGSRIDMGYLWAVVGLLGAWPLIVIDPRILRLDVPGAGAMRLFLSVVPYCCATGLLTPMLVDGFAGGDPRRAGTAYAVNILGSIAGPLIAGFLLLPHLSESSATGVLLAGFYLAGLPLIFKSNRSGWKLRLAAGVGRLYLGAGALACLLALGTKDRVSALKPNRLLRDSTASVAALGTGPDRLLLVNGVGITTLTPITKWMAHLPLAFLPRHPTNALVICFGMGTTFRSLLSWRIPTTAVELVPSVPRVFDFFHSDAPAVLSSPLARVVVDDGRRFLERTRDQYDVITIDPAPPVEAAGASLLYTRQFYDLIKKRLRADGILQAWYWRDGPSPATLSAIAAALKNAFPYVRVFHIPPDGFHFLASRNPIPNSTPRQLARRLPSTARQDLLEWDLISVDAEKRFSWLLGREIGIERLLAPLPPMPPLDDDRPVNEYYFLRTLFASRANP